MFVLDTNVLSALMKPGTAPEAAKWVAAKPIWLLFTVSVCQAEILAGLALMPEGSRRKALEAAARIMFLEDFNGRVLPFDDAAAIEYAELLVRRRRAGRPTSTIDLMVASVAKAKGGSVVTRDIGGFEGCGLTLINPWNAL